MTHGTGELHFVEYQNHLILKKSCLWVLNIDVFKNWIQDWINSMSFSIWICRRYQKGQGKGMCLDFRWVHGSVQSSCCCHACASMGSNLSTCCNVCWKGVLEVKGMLKHRLSTGYVSSTRGPRWVRNSSLPHWHRHRDTQASVLTNTFTFTLWSTLCRKGSKVVNNYLVKGNFAN